MVAYPMVPADLKKALFALISRLTAHVLLLLFDMN
jgi:hypothetical protein